MCARRSFAKGTPLSRCSQPSTRLRMHAVLPPTLAVCRLDTSSPSVMYDMQHACSATMARKQTAKAVCALIIQVVMHTMVACTLGTCSSVPWNLNP